MNKLCRFCTQMNPDCQRFYVSSDSLICKSCVEEQISYLAEYPNQSCSFCKPAAKSKSTRTVCKGAAICHTCVADLLFKNNNSQVKQSTCSFCRLSDICCGVKTKICMNCLRHFNSLRETEQKQGIFRGYEFMQELECEIIGSLKNGYSVQLVNDKRAAYLVTIHTYSIGERVSVRSCMVDKDNRILLVPAVNDTYDRQLRSLESAS